MKKFVFLFIGIICFQIALSAQALQTQNDFYQRKVVKFTKMRNTGIGLGIGGAVLTVAGIVMVSQAKWTKQTDDYGYQNNNNSNYTTTDGSGVVGLFSIIVGVPMAVSGIVLGSIGSSKVNYYRQKLNGLSFKVNYTKDVKGLTLAYDF